MNDRPLLSESDLDEIEAEAMTNEAETYRGPLLALVGEVRRLRRVVLEGAQPGGDRAVLRSGEDAR